VEDVAATIGVSQPRVRRARVEQDLVASFRHVGQCEQILGGGVDDDEARLVFGDRRREGGPNVRPRLDDRRFEGNRNADEAPRCIRVLDPELGAFQPFVRRVGRFVVQRRRMVDTSLI
jgi:hypothetical protein